MSEKEEVLRQISEIKSHLIDKETFFPYNYNACHVWSVIAVVLTLSMMPTYQYSIVLGGTLTSILIVFGFLVEGSLTKKENESYDIDDCTKRQQFIMQNFIMLSLFGIVLSILLAQHQLYVVIFLIWLFLIALGQFAVGFVLNVREFSSMAMFNISMALILLALGSYFNLLEEQGLFFTLVQTVVIFGLAVLPSWVAYRQQTLVSNHQKACGV